VRRSIFACEAMIEVSACARLAAPRASGGKAERGRISGFRASHALTQGEAEDARDHSSACADVLSWGEFRAPGKAGGGDNFDQRARAFIAALCELTCPICRDTEVCWRFHPVGTSTTRGRPATAFIALERALQSPGNTEAGSTELVPFQDRRALTGAAARRSERAKKRHGAS